MITCDECGTQFRPMTNANRCPECSTENYPEEDSESHAEPPVGGVFSNCNVCGIPLRTFDEEAMGMCEQCAAE